MVAYLHLGFSARSASRIDRRGIVAVGKYIARSFKRRLESGWVFLRETFAKFRRRKLWGGYVDNSLTVEASVPPQPDTRINLSTLRPADGSPTTTVAQSSENNAWDNKPHKACFKGSTAQTRCLQLGQLAILDTSDPQLCLQRIKPNSCPHIAAWRRINMSHRPVSVQLLAELSPKDATVFALVTDAASQTTAKSMSVSTGEALSPILDEVEKRMYITAGTLAEEYTEAVSLANATSLGTSQCQLFDPLIFAA
ncbi:hypothetical protein WJX77_009389 [Trebouxia sp. C0004]